MASSVVGTLEICHGALATGTVLGMIRRVSGPTRPLIGYLLDSNGLLLTLVPSTRASYSNKFIKKRLKAIKSSVVRKNKLLSK